jgi:hypothetical protein
VFHLHNLFSFYVLIPSFMLNYTLPQNSIFGRSVSLQFSRMCLAFSFPKRRLWFPLSLPLLDPLIFQISFFHPRFTITFTSSAPFGLLFLTLSM